MLPSDEEEARVRRGVAAEATALLPACLAVRVIAAVALCILDSRARW